MSIWNKLHQNLISTISIYFLLFLSFIAIYAPLIANNKPFIMKTTNKTIFLDTLDSSVGNIDLAIQRINKQNNIILLEKEKVWLVESISRVKNFLEDQNSIKKIARFHILKIIQNRNKNKLLELRDFLEQMRIKKIKSKYFFPILNSLSTSEIFFMVIPLFLLFLKLLKSKLKFLKNRSFIDLFAFALLLALVFSLFTSLRKSSFDPYNYKVISKNFTQSDWAIFPIIPYGENENIISDSSKPPSNKHILGTDPNGRDVLARMVYGTRISMSVGFVAVSIYVLIGIFVGAIAGFYAGKIDIIISRIIEVVNCFPVFFFILIVMSFVKPSIYIIMLLIGITGWPGIARLMRGEFLRLKNQEYVFAAKSLGARDSRIIFHHIMPNGLAPIIVSATFGIAGAILLESSLSFLGFGVPQPTASWGDILNSGRINVYGNWWLTVFPGIAIFLTVTAFNLIGDTLRDILDPRLKGIKSKRALQEQMKKFSKQKT